MLNCAPLPASACSQIESCRVCGHSDLRIVLDLGMVPLADRFVVPEQSSAEPRFPLSIWFCGACSLLQLKETVAPELLFAADYPYYSSVSSAWLRHCRQNAEELMASRELDQSSRVVEIASNDGYLLQNYVRAGIPVLGIDPAPGPVAEAVARGVDSRCEFFGSDVATELTREGCHADVIHGNNVLAHVAKLHDVVEGIRILLKPEGVAVLEMPYVGDLVMQCQFDTMYHEHLCYFSLTALQQLFTMHGLSVNSVRRLSTHGGSLRIFVQHRHAPDRAVCDLLAEEVRNGLTDQSHYSSFTHRVQTLQRSFRDGLETLCADGRTVWGYAAAAKATTLLNTSEIRRELLPLVVDRNPHKQGLLTPGLQIPIVSPDRIRQTPPDYLLLLAWNLRDEIVAEQQQYQTGGGRFIVPVPRFEVI